ncbi:MAG TPA: methyltransferase domain-containing protein [Drouetiella sp.]
MLTRKRVPELMDDPSLDSSSHFEALRGLERLNFFSSSASSLWSRIKPLAQTARNLSILDIATGGGDIPISLYSLAKNDDLNLSITGADISQTALDYAQGKAARCGAKVDFIKLDALNDEIPSGYDVVTTNLFTHHLDPPDVIKLLRRMGSSAQKLVLVNDLVRSNVSYSLVWLATRLLTRSPVVQYDGPVSVQGSYTGAEFLKMATEAGLANSEIQSCPPCRQILHWVKS